MARLKTDVQAEIERLTDEICDNVDHYPFDLITKGSEILPFSAEARALPRSLDPSHHGSRCYDWWDVVNLVWHLASAEDIKLGELIDLQHALVELDRVFLMLGEANARV